MKLTNVGKSGNSTITYDKRRKAQDDPVARRGVGKLWRVEREVTVTAGRTKTNYKLAWLWRPD